MAAKPTAEALSLQPRKIRLPKPIDEIREQYQNARPFSHVVLRDMFPAQLLDKLLAEISARGNDDWLNVEQDTRERTRRMRSAAHLGEAGEQLVALVHSAPFLYLLSEITGISELLPDPYLQGAGYALMRRGDYFSVHSDRSVAYETGMTRRLAMIIFLNKGWRPDYAGQLELWNSDATKCDASIEPLFNTTALFEVAYPNYHGVPTPIACPADRSRQSFIVYYHTVGGPGKSPVKPATTKFAPRLHGSNRITLRAAVRDITPPVLARAIRKIFKPKV